MLWYSVVAGLLPIQLSVEIYDVIVPVSPGVLGTYTCGGAATLFFKYISLLSNFAASSILSDLLWGEFSVN